MQRRINDLQIARSVDALFEHRRNIGGVDFLLAIDDLAGGQPLGKVHALDVGDFLHVADGSGIVGRQKLPAAGPVDFHRVVRRRIVAGRDHDAAVAFFMSHAERQLRRAAVAIEEIDRELGGGHDFRAQLGKMPGIVPGIVGNDTGERTCFHLIFDVVGQSLGTFAYGSIINGVTTYRIHPAAAPAGAKGNYRPKGIVEFFPTGGRYVFNHLRGIFGQIWFGKPDTDVF